MTLPKDVAGAADALDIYHGDAGSWKTIRAHLLSQDASNQRLREIGRKAVLANADLRQQTYVLESRLAAADALLRTFAKAVIDTAFQMAPPNQWTPVFVQMAQEAERQAHLQSSDAKRDTHDCDNDGEHHGS